VAEGDTILRLARRFEQTLVGKVVAASAPNPRGRAAGVERLDGRPLEAAEARGKHLLLAFGELSLHSHLGMSGGWHVYRQGARWRRSRSSAWAVLSGGGWEAVQFGGPTLEVIATDRLRRDPRIARLGPDVLADRFDEDAAVAAIRADPTRAVGDALLHQRLVAGIGNIFKSEACFAAGADPWRRVADLGDDEIRRTLAAARRLMQESVAEGRPDRAVYKRAGRPCPACGTPIEARGQGDANRRTYWCPRCQAGERRAK